MVDEPRDAGSTAGDPLLLVSSKGSRIGTVTGRCAQENTSGMNRISASAPVVKTDGSDALCYWESYVTENGGGALRRIHFFLHRP